MKNLFRVFADLFQDATKDHFETLATTAKCTVYGKIYAHLNLDSETGVVSEPAAILKEVTHLFEAEPIGGIAGFLQTTKAYKLKIAHGFKLCAIGIYTSCVNTNRAHLFPPHMRVANSHT